jgi:DNA-binding transcriptional MerR regulator
MVDEEYNAELEGGSPFELSGEVGRPRIRKAADAFRTISEVADELHVPQHVLRFWETKFPQVRPLKRGGGRRYYRPEDVALLRRVADLLYTEGYTIKGVQRLLRDSAVVVADPPQAEPEQSPAQEKPALLQDLPAEAESQQDASGRESEAPASPAPEGQPTALEDEIIRLRGLLFETLSALEDMRRTLG